MYAGDVGFYYAITGKKDYGRIYENIVYLELRRRIKGNQEIHYWKNRERNECDFIIKEGFEIQELFQVISNMKEEKTRKYQGRARFQMQKDYSNRKT